MFSPLEPCSTCQRHVRTTATECPFCTTPRAAQQADTVRSSEPIRGPLARPTRAQLVFGSTLTAACVGGTIPNLNGPCPF